MSQQGEPASLGRGIAAVAGAVIFFAVATRVIEQTSANLVLTTVLNVGAAFLVGFVSARIAGANELTVVGVAAAAETCMLAYGWTVGAYNALPIWFRALLLLTTGPGMITGAWIRMQARLATREPR